MKKKLLLVDGNALYFKAFWGSYIRIKDGKGPRLPNGTPVNALSTFAFMIMNLKEKFQPNKILVAFDERGGHTHRHKYDFYKAGRKKQPDELYSQLPLVWEFLDYYGIKRHSKKEIEADDIIGIMAEEGKNSNLMVEIVTTDKDLLQLVDYNVNVYLSIRGVTEMELYSMENFKEKFHNLEPRHIVDFKGIAGDASDNLEGIKGIGEKTAIKLLLEHDSLEEIFKKTDKFTPSLKDKIINGKEMGELSKKLAYILRKEDAGISINELDVKNPNFDKLEEFFSHIPINNVPQKLRKERERSHLLSEEGFDSIEEIFKEIKF